MGRHLPYSIKPELVRGCTMRCVFCGLRHQSWAEQEYKMVDTSFFRNYCIDMNRWRPKVRMEIANRGEQTIHPEFIELMAWARVLMPKVQILVTTNTDMMVHLEQDPHLFREWVEECMKAGVNIFMLDCYTPKRLKLITEAFHGRYGTFFEDEQGSSLNPYPYRGPDFKAICIKDATPAPKENVLLHYHNQGGNADVSDNANALRMYPNVTPPKEPLKWMCTRPFREFPIWYDGSVPICCDDWGDQAIVGKYPEQSLPELWDLYDPYRKNLIDRNRAAQMPCAVCTERQGKRFGLELNWFREQKDE